MITPAAFVQEWQGRQCCNGGLCQCVALARQWMQETGAPLPTVGNTAATLQFPVGWENVGLDRAESGDLVVYSANLPGSGGDGHIDLYVQRIDGSSYQGLDQNFGEAPSTNPEATYCHLVNHGPQDTQYVQAVWRYWMQLDASDPIVQELRDGVGFAKNQLIFGADVTIDGQPVHTRIGLIADTFGLLQETKAEVDKLTPGGGPVTPGSPTAIQLADALDAMSAKLRAGG